MIVSLDITKREPLAGGAAFGAAGAYERVEGVAAGALDPTHPGNRGIALLDRAPRNAAGMVEYRSGFILFRPADPDQGNGRLLYEVNNRGRIMMLANLCAGPAGNDPKIIADLGNALPLRLGFALLWTGWDTAAPRATGLWLDAPAIEGLTQAIREEFVSGTRRGVHERFRLSHEAVRVTEVTVRRAQTADRMPVAFEHTDARIVTLAAGEKPVIGSIHEIRYEATNPRVQGIGFAATRDIVGHIRAHGPDIAGRAITHTLAFGISQAGRYLRDHIAHGYNADESGVRVFDGVLTHVAGIGRVFLNTAFAQPFRTRTWHEDHDFPEVEFPFSAATLDDPLTGASGGLMRGDASDPKLIETNTATEYWQKGASLLHTDPLGTRDVALPANVRGYLIAGTQHGGKAGMPRDLGSHAPPRASDSHAPPRDSDSHAPPRDTGPCVHPRNWHDPMAAVRALLVALDAWVVSGREPPASRLPRIEDGSLVGAGRLAFPVLPGVTPPAAANPVYPLPDWTDPARPSRAWTALVPQVDTDGNEIAGIRLPDIAVPRGTHTGWNLYREPYPAGQLADRDGAFLAFAATEAARVASGDPRPSLEVRHAAPDDRASRLRHVVEDLRRDRLLLAGDAERYLSDG